MAAVAQARDLPGRSGIASAHPLATTAGYEVLRDGGNAFDAAVAVSAALAVVEPHSSGLGGGGFFLLYLADEDRYVFVDAREVAPGAASPSTYLDDAGQPVRAAALNGPLAAGIPGLAAGWQHVVDRYGRLPLARSLQSAIRYAEDGFPAYSRLALGVRFRRRVADQWPGFGEVFYPEGVNPEDGTAIVQQDLGNTLKRIAADGAAAFYRGELAAKMVDGVRAAGGNWTLDDLARYSVVERAPVVTQYFGNRIVTAPLPSSGGVAITTMLNILAGYSPAELTGAQGYHVIIESMRRAYRDRAEYLGDPAFTDAPLARLMHPDYATGLRAGIDLERATRSAELTGLWPEDTESRQTTHFSILDAEGNRVAATLTINGWFGSGFIPPGTGIILNNEMDDFSLAAANPNTFGLLGDAANAVAPGKRPLSSMSPTFVESDRGIAIVGTPGGSRIITMVFRAALAWMAGANADEMVALKRFHHQYFPDEVVHEPGAFSPEEFQSLTERGHLLRESRRPFGNMNVVTWDYSSNQVEAASDPRGAGEGRVY